MTCSLAWLAVALLLLSPAAAVVDGSDPVGDTEQHGAIATLPFGEREFGTLDEFSEIKRELGETVEGAAGGKGDGKPKETIAQVRRGCATGA